MRFSAGLTLILLLASCGRQKPVTQEAIRPGNIRVVHCQADTSQRYVLFEPDGFPGDKKWPLIICFDPHADGSLPVDRLKGFAGEQGYLIAGSDNLKNGLATADYSLRILLDELRTSYPVDPEQIYLAGFSGGARIALSLAMTSPDFRGVIICGAGAPGADLSRMPGKTAIYGLAGDGDVNFQEVEALPGQPVPQGVRVFARIFHGTHAWPPASEMYRAMTWMHLDGMRSGLIDKNDVFIDRYKNQLMDSASWCDKQKDLLAALKLYQLGISSLDGLSSVRPFRKEETEILNSDSWGQHKKEESRIRTLENTAREQYARAILEKDTSWWRKEVNSLEKYRHSQAGPALTAMYNRLFGFMSIMAYTYSNRSIQSGDWRAARRFVDIYGIIDPENPDYQTFRALTAVH
jgi:poly(3-hydroxybutyrate) depolymerase